MIGLPRNMSLVCLARLCIPMSAIDMSLMLTWRYNPTTGIGEPIAFQKFNRSVCVRASFPKIQIIPYKQPLQKGKKILDRPEILDL